MPKSLALGNGHILICFDKNGYLRDFYFPYVGVENHIGSIYSHKIGIYVDHSFSWLHDNSWQITVSNTKETLTGNTNAINSNLGLWVNMHDAVYNEKNIFLRRVTIHNARDKKRTVKLFFNQEFQISSGSYGDTGYFDPIHNVIIHYKGNRAFLINAIADGKGFDDYSIGMFRYEGKEGTWKDAEDGILSKNAIEHGSVDSVIGITCDIEARESVIIHYWIAAAASIREIHDLNDYVLIKTPEHCLNTTKDFWHAWVNKTNFNYYGLDEKTIDLFKKSLLIIRTHVDDNGSILASGDADMLQHGKDTYGYMWPRDGAFTSIALDKAGDYQITERFFRLCNDLLSTEGYFLHKYRADKSLGSSWHPWIREGEISLPIQEDETALVIHALWHHFELTRDLELIEDIYNSLIVKAADFMLSYRDKTTGLPNPSYDLWEEHYGIFTFSSAATYAALIAAGKFARMLGKKIHERTYYRAAQQMQTAILKYLYNKEHGTFYKMIRMNGNESGAGEKIIYDGTLDASSVFGIFKFGILDSDDKILAKAVKIYEEQLICKTASGGIARYQGDKYYRQTGGNPGNPWFITSLWFAQYHIMTAKNEKDLGKVKDWLSWAAARALPSGILSEQLNPFTSEQLSAAPLTWSHAEYVTTVIEYLNKLEELGIAKKCIPTIELP